MKKLLIKFLYFMLLFSFMPLQTANANDKSIGTGELIAEGKYVIY